MGTQLELSGRTGRRALVALLATVVVFLSVGAVQANAASITAFPSMQGAGSVTGPGLACSNASLLNGTVVGCATVVVDTGLFSNFASMVLSAAA